MAIKMKTQQTSVEVLCKCLLITGLVVLQFSMSLSASVRASPREQQCLQLQAVKVELKNLPKSFTEHLIIGSEVFSLKIGSTSPDHLFRDAKSLKTCNSETEVFSIVVPGTHDMPLLDSVDLEAPPVWLVAPLAHKQESSALLKLSCDNTAYCANISFTGPYSGSLGRLNRRSVSGVPSEGDAAQGASVTAGVLVTALGLLVLISVAALCGGSKTYETGHVDVKLNEPDPVAVVVTPQPIDTNSPPSNQHQNGSLSGEPPQPVPSNREQALTPPPVETTSDKQDRARSLSARSYDPLPELPKLELAEAKDAIEDKDEDDPYSYARVPQADEVPQSESSDEGEDTNSPKQPTVPPYGKVTSDKGKGVVNDGEYAEVVNDGKRERSITAPVDPAELLKVREARAFTESATHLPLPAIPKGPQPLLVEENDMYDSIPDDMKEVKQPKKKDRLYESVDEMGDENDDTYESVPEELKPDSPSGIMSPVVVTPSSPERLLVSPKPPDSPIPTIKHANAEKPEEPQGKGKKKALEKTLSATDPEKQKGRSFSLFGRKKAPSVSAAASKASKRKQEKEKEREAAAQTKPHQGEPLPDIPSPKETKPHQGEPLPDIPTPTLPTAPVYDDDEDMYDRPLLPLDTEPKSRHISESDVPPTVRTTEEAKARAKTLPAGMRSAGVSAPFKSRQDLPLPEVPEDSGKGIITVARSRLLEDGMEVTEPYDVVHIVTPPPTEDDFDPYDTVRPELIVRDPSSEVRGEADPGYDKVGIKLGEDHQSDSEHSTSPGGDITVSNLGGMSSPEDSMIGGASPEHDEVGYAQVPEMYRLRKRAMSSTHGDKPKSKSGPKSAADDDRSTSPEAQYAIIDKAKKKPKRADNPSLSTDERESGGTSPIPPPLPPAMDLGDISEFDQPPLPERSEEMDQLVVNVESDAGYSRVLKVTPNPNADPPYAKVKSKDEHPYAELQIGDTEEVKPDLVERAESPKPVLNEMSSGYDTVGPTASPVESSSDQTDSNAMYDCLAPAEASSPPEVSISTESPEPEENTYDTLDPQVERVSPEMEGPYDVIDEDKRQTLQKMHQH